jgi:hypothetical protein
MTTGSTASRQVVALGKSLNAREDDKSIPRGSVIAQRSVMYGVIASRYPGEVWADIQGKTCGPNSRQALSGDDVS